MRERTIPIGGHDLRSEPTPADPSVTYIHQPRFARAPHELFDVSSSETDLPAAQANR